MTINFKTEAAMPLLWFASVEIMTDPEDSEFVYARLNNSDNGDVETIQHCVILWDEEGFPYFVFNNSKYMLNEFMRV